MECEEEGGGAAHGAVTSYGLKGTSGRLSRSHLCSWRVAYPLRDNLPSRCGKLLGARAPVQSLAACL